MLLWWWSAIIIQYATSISYQTLLPKPQKPEDLDQFNTSATNKSQFWWCFWSITCNFVAYDFLALAYLSCYHQSITYCICHKWKWTKIWVWLCHNVLVTIQSKKGFEQWFGSVESHCIFLFLGYWFLHLGHEIYITRFIGRKMMIILVALDLLFYNHIPIVMHYPKTCIEISNFLSTNHLQNNHMNRCVIGQIWK